MSKSLNQKPGCLWLLFKLLAPQKDGGGSSGGRWPYEKKRYLLSRAEFSFYRVLQQACGERFVICPKVRLGDLIYVKKGTEKRMGWVNKINRRHLDFVLCDPQTMSPVLAVELDDASHDSESSKKRDNDKDKACRDAGLKLLRVRARRAYDLNAISVELAKL